MCYNALIIGKIAHFCNIHFCLLVNVFGIQKTGEDFVYSPLPDSTDYVKIVFL